MPKIDKSLRLEETLIKSIEALAQKQHISSEELYEVVLDDYVRRQARAEVRFPGYRKQLQELVEQHRELKNEPLLLAIYYTPENDGENLYLIEVIENFGGGSVDPERELAQVEFASTDAFPLANKQKLILTLTNPVELRVAKQDNWKTLIPIIEAIEKKRFEVLYSEPSEGARLMESLLA